MSVYSQYKKIFAGKDFARPLDGVQYRNRFALDRYLMEEVTFSVTPYRGHEEEILRIRNNNRSEPQTRDYIEWRYAGEKSPYFPIIYWVHLSDGTRVGMASINFRPYWADNKLLYFAVLGDISLDVKMRGKGIGKRLLQYATTHIKNKPYDCSLVIPNDAIKRSLDSLGWITPEPFAWYIWFINPASKIYELLKIKIIANVLSAAYAVIIRIKLSPFKIDRYQIEAVEAFDESFDALWKSYKKTGIILRDRSRASLQWRYERHPCRKYSTTRILHEGNFIGYVIYELADDRKCFIVDMLMIENKFIKPAMKIFLQYVARNKVADIVRFKLNMNHPYARKLKEMGFIRKMEGDVFKTFVPDKTTFPVSCKWFLTRGDKDT